MRVHPSPVLVPHRGLRALVLAGAGLLAFAAVASAGPGVDAHDGPAFAPNDPNGCGRSSQYGPNFDLNGWRPSSELGSHFDPHGWGPEVQYDPWADPHGWGSRADYGPWFDPNG
jgi:hypothetical protein